MKWNDKYLLYSGKQKTTIYNYIVSITKALSSKKIEISPVNIVNFILNDINWDIQIFESSQNHTWFVKEFKNNPFLIDFVISEVIKVKDLPNIYNKQTSLQKDNLFFKSKYFSKIIQKFIISNPAIPHYYFSNIITDELKNEIDVFVKANYRKLKCKRRILEIRYSKLVQVREVLRQELGIECTIFVINNTLILREKNNNFIVNSFRWGDFPLVHKRNSENQLFCISDDISVYVLGYADYKTIQQFSNPFFLFLNENQKQQFQNKSAFYGFKNNILNLNFQKG